MREMVGKTEPEDPVSNALVLKIPMEVVSPVEHESPSKMARSAVPKRPTASSTPLVSIVCAL